MSFSSSRVRSHWKAFVAAGVVALLAIPGVVWAADRFTDVTDSNVFHDDISWLANTGITKGCNPPDNTLFCPDDSVTRGQMAAFLQRSAPVITRLLYDGSDGDATIGAQYEPLRTVGTVDKVNDGTALRLDWDAHAARVGGSFCEFQLRVDAANENGNTSADFENAAGGAVVMGEDAVISVTALFTGLPAGERQVQIWVRGDATQCNLNDGDFGQGVLVTETPYTDGEGEIAAP